MRYVFYLAIKCLKCFYINIAEIFLDSSCFIGIVQTKDHHRGG